MTVLSRISVHFGATQRTQGETLHTRKTGNTDGGESVWTSKTKAEPHFTTASLLTPKQQEKNHIFQAKDSRVYSQHKNTKPKEDF